MVQFLAGVNDRSTVLDGQLTMANHTAALQPITSAMVN